MKIWEGISRAFYTIGIFFFAMSLGWAFGLRSAHADIKTVGLFFGIGILGLFAGAFIQAKNASLRKRLREKNSRHDPIDLDACFRAYRNYGEQIPLLETLSLRSEAFALSGKKNFELPSHCDTLLVEVWDGQELKVTHGEKIFRLNHRTLCKIDVSEKILILDPVLGAGEGSCQGLIHFFSSGQTVD
jgi:hypothetical protein